LESRDGASNQKWSPTATSSGNYRLTPANATGSALEVQHSSTANGALLEIWAYSGGNSQQWSFQAP
jgi:glucosylceramidase